MFSKLIKPFKRINYNKCKYIQRINARNFKTSTVNVPFLILESKRLESTGIHRDFETKYKTINVNDIKNEINNDVKGNKVFLFMKGNPSNPECGYSKNVCDILNHLNINYKYKNVLSHPALKQIIKEYSEWPTFPQLYYNGNLIGGHDIVLDMFKNGELEIMFGINTSNNISNSNNIS